MGTEPRSKPRPAGLAARLRREGVYRLTGDQLLRAAEAGVFGDDRVELVGGVIYRKQTDNRFHNFASGQLHEMILRALPPGQFADAATPLHLSRHWRPEPDIMVACGHRRDYLPNYRQTTLYRPEDELPLILDGREVARFRVAEILP